MNEPILFVGQAPSRSPKGRSGRRVAAFLDLSLDEFDARFGWRNLLPYFPGKHGKGDRFPLAEARRAAAAFDFGDARSVVLLGKNVAGAFGILPFLPPMIWLYVGERRLAWIPHPSGVNLWYNDPENVRAVRLFLAALKERNDARGNGDGGPGRDAS